MTKILVTGAGGYIGSVATYLALQKGLKVVAVDNYSTGFKGPLQLLQRKFGQDNLKIYERDIRDNMEDVFKAEKDIKAVIHYAAFCSVNESMQNPQKYFSNNVCGSQALLDSMIKNNVKKIVFSSTCAVYGEAEYVPVDENHPTSPTNPYGASKRMAEQLIEWYGKLSGLSYIILRYFNVCGASDDGLIGDAKKPSVHLMQNAVRGSLGIEQFSLTCPEVDTKDKTPVRDYVNVVDLNMAHLKALKYLFDGGKSEIINIGTGTGNSVLEIIENVEKATGAKLNYGRSNQRQGEYAKMVADNKKAKEILGWSPQRVLPDSIKSLLSWYKDHPQGWPE